MRKTIILLTLSCLALSNSYGQQSVMGNIPGKQIDLKTGSHSVLTQLPIAPPKTHGDVYLNPDWELAEITLVGARTQLNGYPAKLNLQTNAFEIQYEEQVKVLPGARVSHFTFITKDAGKEKYVNGKGYVLNDHPIEGFLQVVDSGKWMLLVKKELKVIEATYNPALHVGSRDNEFVQDAKSFLSKGNRLYEIDLPPKKFCRQFVGHEEAISRFLKEEKISLKKDADVTKLLAFLNHSI